VPNGEASRNGMAPLTEHGVFGTKRGTFAPRL
jgi:hypothetical protein